MAAAGAKKHSKFDKQEVIQGLNPLYTPQLFTKNPAACIDIIAVPGLGSDMTHTWMAKNVHWLKDENMLQKVVPDARIIVFGYRSQWYGPDAVETRISSIADDLLHHIHQERHGKNSKRPIIFLGHSLGGLVIAKAVSEAKRRPEDYPGIFSCITSCVFLGTPFRGSEAQPFAQLIGMAGDTIGLAKYTDLIRSLKSGSIELDDLANDFLGDSRKASIELVCYYETENTMAKPEWDIGKLFKTGVVIASRKSSTFEGYPSHPWARTHSEMNKFDGPKDVQYRGVSGTLKEMAQKSFKLMKLRQDSVRQDYLNDSRVDRVLEGLEVINLKKDLKTIRSTQGTSPSWIQEDVKYTEWKEGKTHQNLWISGNPGMGKTKAAISMLDDLEKVANADRERDDSPALAYFFCDEQDREKSKAINVLKMLVWQLLKAKRFLTRHFFTEDTKNKGNAQKGGEQSSAAFEFYSLPDLWKSLKAALVDPSLGTVYFLVNSFDQIDSESRKEFLDLFTSWQPPVLEDEDGSAPVVKWLFLSVPRIDIQDGLHDAARINLDDGSNSTKQNGALRKLVAEEVHQISEKKGYSRSLEYFAKAYISFRAEGKSNHDWVKLVCLELSYDNCHYSTIRQHLESLPSDLGPMYDQLSRRVLSIPASDVELSKEILRSLLLVYSPPTLLELAVIADFPESDRKNEEAIINHVHMCGAFTRIQIFESDGKLRVQLSYNSVRDYLKSKYNDWLSMPSEQIQHGIIALRCFEYVRAAVREVDSDQAENQSAAPEHEDAKEDAEENAKEDAEEDAKEDAEEDAEEEDEEDEEDENSQIVDPLVYPYTKWIEHALEATPDVVESLGLEEVFWVLESEERMKWSKSYSNLNEEEDFDVDFTALHIAAYFGYVPLADLLLRNESHKVELSMPDSNGHQPLYWACKRDRMNMVQKLCDEGADVNEYQNDAVVGLTPLHGAASSGSVEITEYILNKAAAVDVPNEFHGTALYAAVDGEFLHIVRLLLDRGANPNAIGGDEQTPLNAAANNGNLEIAQLLVSRGAYLNPDIEYSWGNALSIAALQGYTETFKYLLEQGCHFDEPNLFGKYPLGIAAEGGFTEMVEMLLDFDTNPQSQDQALELAVEANLPDCVKVLLERCPALQRSDAFAHAARNGFADILGILTQANITTDVINTALYEAADHQHVETVRVLLDMGADPNAEGEEYGNALLAAAYDGTKEIVQMLLDNNADVNRAYGEETFGTALQAAAFEGSLANVELLVQRGASINTTSCGKYGNALNAACCAGKDKVVEFLLSRNADPNARGGPSSYPIVAATDSGYERIVGLLVQYHADVNVSGGESNCTPLINAAMQLPRATVELLYDRGARIHDFDDDHDTALLAAAATGDTDTVTFLLDKGSDIKNIGKWGGALYRAVEVGVPECIKLLLDRGIDVNQEGGEMQTPLQAAASLGNIETVKLLLENGASVHVAGGTYHTPLQAAASNGSLEIVQLLLDRGANVNEQGGKDGSPLHAAVHASSEELIDLLLLHGADINAVDNTTGSVLSIATRRASTEVVNHLIEQKADINIRGGKYETALQVSCYMGTVEEATMLLEKGADPMIEGGFYGSALGAAASVGSEDVMELLLKQEHKPTPRMLAEALYTAVHYRQAAAIKILLENGADVTAKSPSYTSLFDALEKPLSEDEIAQTTFTGDGDDDDDESDSDSDSDDADGDEDNDEDDEDQDDSSEGSNTESSEDSEDDVEAAEKIEIYEGIKQMLTEALDAVKPQTPAETQPIFELSAYNDSDIPQQNHDIYATRNIQNLETPKLQHTENSDSPNLKTSFQTQHSPLPESTRTPYSPQNLNFAGQSLDPGVSINPSNSLDRSNFNYPIPHEPFPSHKSNYSIPAPANVPENPISEQSRLHSTNLPPQLHAGYPRPDQRVSIPRKQVGGSSSTPFVTQGQYQAAQSSTMPQGQPRHSEQFIPYKKNMAPQALQIGRQKAPTELDTGRVLEGANPAVQPNPAYSSHVQGLEFNDKLAEAGHTTRWSPGQGIAQEYSPSGYAQGPQVINPRSQFSSDTAINNYGGSVSSGPDFNPVYESGQSQNYDQRPMVSRESSGPLDGTTAGLKNKWKRFMS